MCTGKGSREGGADLDEVDLVLGAERLDELDVLALGARLVQDAEVSLALVEGLGSLAETAGEAVVDEGLFEDLLEGVLDRHLALGGLGLLDLDLDVLDLVDNRGLASVITHGSARASWMGEAEARARWSRCRECEVSDENGVGIEGVQAGAVPGDKEQSLGMTGVTHTIVLE